MRFIPSDFCKTTEKFTHVFVVTEKYSLIFRGSVVIRSLLEYNYR